MLLLSVYASNLRLEATTSLEAKKAAVAAMYTGLIQTGTVNTGFKVWREDAQMVWGQNTETGQEAAYMMDFRTNGGVEYIEGVWQVVDEEQIPKWVRDYLNEKEGESDASEL